jgi:hypothetical protein
VNVKWLLENGMFDEKEPQIVKSIKDAGSECVLLDFAHYMPDSVFLDLFEEEDCVVVHGSLQFITRIRRAAKWIPGAYCNLDAYECNYYYPRVGEYLLNRNYIMLPVGELARQRNRISRLYESSKIFVRPSSGFKYFTGCVIDLDNWEKDSRNIYCYNIEPEKVVVVAPVYPIETEWRFVVVGDTIITGSQYMSRGEIAHAPGYPQEAFDYAQGVVQKTEYRPDRVFVIDVCQIFQGDFFVVEFGGFSTCGMYENDWSKIVPAVSAAALKEWEEYQ